MRTGWLVAALVVTGCVAETKPPAQTFFAAQCARCHGDTARGDGVLSADLPIAPPDLTLLAERNGGTFPTEAAMAQIYGYPGRFHRGIMPEFGSDLGADTVPWAAADGTVIETPRLLVDLVAWLDSIQR